VRLILVRHAESTSNVRHILDATSPGPELTARGLDQAVQLPAALAAFDVDAVYASSLTRAQQTAAPFAASIGLPVIVRDGLREISAGSLELRGDDESMRAYFATVDAWHAGDLARRMPGGDDGSEVLARFDAVVAEIAGLGVPVVLVVSHGAMIRFWIAARTNEGPAALVAAEMLENTGVIELDGDTGAGWSVRSWIPSAVAQPGSPGL